MGKIRAIFTIFENRQGRPPVYSLKGVVLLQHSGPNNVALFPTVPVFQRYPRNPHE